MNLRLATFNIENLDGEGSSRFKILRPQLERLKADVICFQEIHGQERVNQPRDIITLRRLLEDTSYEDFNLVSTKTQADQVYDKRNLVIASKYEIVDAQQFRGDLMGFPQYKIMTSGEDEPVRDVEWERPIQCARIKVHEGFELYVINLHLKSKIPSHIPNQSFRRGSREAWKSVQSWAEGYFLSSMKRVGQSIETRLLIDKIFEEDPEAHIIVCGDFNAEPEEVPVESLMGSVLNTNNPRLRPKVLIPCENSLPLQSRYTYIRIGKQQLIDHIFMSQSMVSHYRKSEIHNETLIDENILGVTDALYPDSDHAPFVAEFEIPEVSV